MVRPGASRALVEGTFVLTPGGRAADRAVQAGAELDGDLLIASRTVPAQGRSRAHLGGRSVPSAVLAEVGSGLVSVHGQADQLRLRSSAAQRAALDQLGGAEHARRCRDYATAFRAWREAAAALARWQEGAASRAAEAERLRAWLEELEQLDPRPPVPSGPWTPRPAWILPWGTWPPRYARSGSSPPTPPASWATTWPPWTPTRCACPGSRTAVAP